MREVPWDSIIKASPSSDYRARSEAEVFIHTVRETSLEHYLHSILHFLSESESPISLSFALSLILSELRLGSQIISPSFDPLWLAFLDLLARFPTDSSFLHFSSEILAAVASSTQTIDILSFLIEFFSAAPNSALLLLCTVVESTKVSFPIDAVAHFLSFDSNLEFVFAAIVRLFFSLLRRSPSDLAPQSILDSRVVSLPPPFVVIFLRVFLE
jgi:hypothetical protein